MRAPGLTLHRTSLGLIVLLFFLPSLEPSSFLLMLLFTTTTTKKPGAINGENTTHVDHSTAADFNNLLTRPPQLVIMFLVHHTHVFLKYDNLRNAEKYVVAKYQYQISVEERIIATLG